MRFTVKWTNFEILKNFKIIPLDCAVCGNEHNTGTTGFLLSCIFLLHYHLGQSSHPNDKLELPVTYQRPGGFANSGYSQGQGSKRPGPRIVLESLKRSIRYPAPTLKDYPNATCLNTYSPKEPRCQKLTIFTVCNPNLLLVSANFKHWVSIFWGSNGRKIKHCEAEAKSVMLIKKLECILNSVIGEKTSLK